MHGPLCMHVCVRAHGVHVRLCTYGCNFSGRNAVSGTYIDHVDPRLPMSQQTDMVSTDGTGIGVAAECVAAGLGLVTMAEAQERVTLTLRALAGELPGWALPREAQNAWVPTFMSGNTGTSASPGTYASDSTGLLSVGILFAKTYFGNVAPGAPATLNIARLVDKILTPIKFANMFCSTTGAGKSVANGSNIIPWLFEDGGKCSDGQLPAADGYYYYSEMHWFFWMGYHAGCGSSSDGNTSSAPVPCTNEAIAEMWEAFQGRRHRLDYTYGGQQLLTLWPSYVTQLPYYLIHPFNSDPAYNAVFKAQWLAEWAYYNSSGFYAGDDGRYGLGAGPTPAWCAGGTTYIADRMTNATDQQACRMYSPYAVAGYAPVEPETIQRHLLALLATGESVVPITDADTGLRYEILWRKSLLQQDPLITCAWGTQCGITEVDFAAEFFGLASLKLGADFFVTHTNHFPNDPQY